MNTFTNLFGVKNNHAQMCGYNYDFLIVSTLEKFEFGYQTCF